MTIPEIKLHFSLLKAAVFVTGIFSLSLSLSLSRPKTLNISQDRVFQALPKLFFSIQRFLEGDQKYFKIRHTLEVSQSQ